MLNLSGIRILYIGDLNYGSTSLQRLNSFRNLVLVVKPIDKNTSKQSIETLNRIIHQTGNLFDISKLNKTIVNEVSRNNYNIIWIDKGLGVKPEVLKKIKEYNKEIALIHYNPDDPFGKNKKGWKNFISTIPFYDIHFVPRKVNIEEYKNYGAKKVIQVVPFWGYSADYHLPLEVSVETKARLGGNVGFIGSYEEDRERYCHYLAQSEIPIRVWGTNWIKKSGLKHKNLIIEDSGVLGKQYIETICSFDINLCFLRKSNRDLHTSRSIETPACGGFMLAERTDEHLELFEEGKEAEFFSTKEELLYKIKYYLSHPEERKRIALAGYLRCLNSGYSNSDILKKMLTSIKEN